MSEPTPPTETLVAYLLGELSPDEADRVSRIATQDAATRERLESLGELTRHLSTDAAFEPPAAALAAAKRAFRAAQPGVLDKIADALVRIAATLVFDSRVNPQPIGLRGGSSPTLLRFEAEGVELDIEITNDRSGASVLRGAIEDEDDASWTVVIESAEGDAPLARTHADEFGRFRVDLEAARVRISIEDGKRRIELGVVEAS